MSQMHVVFEPSSGMGTFRSLLKFKVERRDAAELVEFPLPESAVPYHFQTPHSAT
jgi:hypothetical protein